MTTASIPIPNRSDRPIRYSRFCIWPGNHRSLETYLSPEESAALVDQWSRGEEIDELLIDLLRVPSPQTEKFEADPNLKRFIAQGVGPRLRSLTGIPFEIDAMGNLVWRFGADRSSAEAGLLFMGYAMTFPPGSMRHPYSGHIIEGETLGLEGKCASGRGACEQKGALAALIYAAAIVVRSRPQMKLPLILAVSLAGETGRHDAAKFILENDRISARSAIVALGTCNRVCLGNKGRIDVEITVRGKSAHSSTPWAGVNAVEGAWHVMERLDKLASGPSHPHLGRSTLTVTQIKSAPEISHTVPDVCRLIIDRRLLPGEEPESVFAEIQATLASLSPWEIDVKPGAFMLPSEVASDCAVAATVSAVSRALTGKAGEYFYSAAALDAGYLNRAGIETIMFGPGDLRLAHTDQDAVALAEVRAAAKIYAATALQLLT